MNDAVKDLVDQERNLRNTIDEYNVFLALPLWKDHEKFLEEQIDLRRDNYELATNFSSGSTMELQYQRGEIAALRLCKTRLHTLVAAMQQEFDLIRTARIQAEEAEGELE